MHVDELYNQASALDYSKANGMLSVSAMRGPGFFPGCIGTVKPVNNLDGLPIMVLGQDFDTKANHAKINELAGEIETNTTWRNLIQLFIDLKLDTGNAFFTNAYMGLRPEERTAKTKNTGQSPAARPGAEGFATACYAFFKVQLKSLKHELILVLGKETAKFLCNAFPDAFEHWRNISTLKRFYQQEHHIAATLHFEDRDIVFLFVIHPSLNGTNRSLVWGKGTSRGREQDLLKKHIPVHILKHKG